MHLFVLFKRRRLATQAIKQPLDLSKRGADGRLRLLYDVNF